MKRNKIASILTLAVAFIYTVSSYAQSSLGGNLTINENGVVYVYGEHSFTEGSGFITPGMIETSRTGAKGHLIFVKGSSWKNASQQGYVNGFVQVLHDQPFIFPIGEDQVYRPIAISGGHGTTAAYFHKNPKQVIKTQAGPVKKISTQEYWVMEGQQLTNVSLPWGKESNIDHITNGQLSDLTIVGYKNGAWHPIASEIQQEIPEGVSAHAALKGAASTLTNGVITTIDPIIPSDYKLITLGTVNENSEATVDPFGIVKIFPNPVVKDIFIDIEKIGIEKGSLIIYSANGQQVAERIFNSQSKAIQQFDASDYATGLYELQIKFEDGVYTKKFIVGRL